MNLMMDNTTGTKLDTNKKSDDEEKRLVEKVEKEKIGEGGTSIRDQFIGCSLVFAACFLFALGLSSAQALGGIVPAFELNAFRSAAELALVATPVTYKKLVLVSQRSHWVWIMLCCFFSSLYNVCFYTAAIYLPVGTLGGANYVMILVNTAALTGVCLRDCSWLKVVSVILCIVGITLSTQPDFLFPGRPLMVYNPVCRLPGEAVSRVYGNNTWNITEGLRNSSITSHHGNPRVLISNEVIGYSLVFVGAVSIVLPKFIIFMKLRDVSSLTITFWAGLTGSVVSAVVMVIVEKPSFPQNIPCVFLMIGHSFGTAGGNICVRMATQLITPLLLSMVESLNIVLLFTLQYTVMKHINPGLHNVYEFAGAGLIVVGNAVSPCCALYRRYFVSESYGSLY